MAEGPAWRGGWPVSPGRGSHSVGQTLREGRLGLLRLLQPVQDELAGVDEALHAVHEARLGPAVQLWTRLVHALLLHTAGGPLVPGRPGPVGSGATAPRHPHPPPPHTGDVPPGLLQPSGTPASSPLGSLILSGVSSPRPRPFPARAPSSREIPPRPRAHRGWDCPHGGSILSPSPSSPWGQGSARRPSPPVPPPRLAPTLPARSLPPSRRPGHRSRRPRPRAARTQQSSVIWCTSCWKRCFCVSTSMNRWSWGSAPPNPAADGASIPLPVPPVLPVPPRRDLHVPRRATAAAHAPRPPRARLFRPHCACSPARRAPPGGGAVPVRGGSRGGVGVGNRLLCAQARPAAACGARRTGAGRHRGPASVLGCGGSCR